MAKLKIANWNIEWMNRWFTGDNDGAPQFKPSAEIQGVSDIDALAKRVANVINGLDADILTIQEGPSRKREMALFVGKYLNDGYKIHGPAGKGQQKLFALEKKDSNVVSGVVRVEEELEFDFDDVWEVDIDADLAIDEYRFTRPPLVLKVTTSTNMTFRLLNIHTKSKYVHRGRRLWENPATKQEFIVQALKARRRISAEAMRIREYLNSVFAEEPEARIVVAGDFNDGPGLDYFERRYLTHNVAGLIAGGPFQPQRMLRHAFIDQVNKDDNYTAIFDDFVDNIDQRRVLLDHIFISASLFWDGSGQRSAQGAIDHEIFNQQIDQNAPERMRQHLPSDHRPQSVVIEV